MALLVWGRDLSVYGLGFVNTPIPIQFNAIGKRFEENSGSPVVGRQSGQSVQSIQSMFVEA